MVGKCFHYDTPPYGRHLFVAIAPSLEKAGWFLCVNITTKRDGCDTTCELFQGEHPALTESISIVLYRKAKEFPAAVIQRDSNNVADMTPALLFKIQTASLCATSRLKIGFQKTVKAYLEPQGQP